MCAQSDIFPFSDGAAQCFGRSLPFGEVRTATTRLEELPLIAPKETAEGTRLVGGYGSGGVLRFRIAFVQGLFAIRIRYVAGYDRAHLSSEKGCIGAHSAIHIISFSHAR